MQLQFVFLANSGEVTRDGRFHALGGGIDGFGFPAVPAVFPSLAVLARIHFSPEECRREYRVTLGLSYPDGRDGGIEPMIRVIPETMGIPYEDLGGDATVCFNLFNLHFPVEGVYRFAVAVDGHQVGELPLVVKVAEIEEGQG